MFVFGSLKDFSASCSWAASSSNSFSHPSAVYFRTLLPFVISVLSVVSPPPCCRQAALCFSYVVCWIWIETLKKTYIMCILLFFSFVGMDSLAVLLASLVVTDDFFRLPIDSLAYRILVSPSWQSFFQYAMMLVYNVLRCILFVSAFERDSGQTAGQTGGKFGWGVLMR